VIFDLFGTLVPNIPLARWRESADEAADLLGAPREGFRELLRRTFDQRMSGALRDGPGLFAHLLGELGLAAPAAALAEADRRRSAFLRACLRPRPGTLECLGELRGRGYRLALATDCSSETGALLDRTPLGAFFAVRAISAELGVTKPDALMYRHVQEGLGVEGSRCLYVGDGNSEELPGARRHGMTTVWIDNGDAQEWHHRFAPGGDHVIRDLRELPSLLR